MRIITVFIASNAEDIVFFANARRCITRNYTEIAAK